MSRNSESVVRGGEAVPSRPSIKTRPCRLCGDDIPLNRIVATKGRATECVPCLELQGDVPRIRRFDEKGADGEVVETVFFNNSYVEAQMMRINHENVIPDAAYEVAVGDDSFLERDNSQPIAAAYSPAEAFEEEEEEVIELMPQGQREKLADQRKQRRPEPEPDFNQQYTPIPSEDIGLHGTA